MNVPYRADNVGSFLRPPELVELRRQSSPDPARLREVEDREILRVLAKQKELGFEIFTDGEFRRSNFQGDFTEAVEGFDFSQGTPRAWQGTTTNSAPQGAMRGVVVSTLRPVRPLTEHELPFLKQHSPGAIKMTLPSATQFPAIAFKRGVTDTVYKDHSALLWDIVEIVKAEIARLAAEGVSYIQIDAPRYSYYIDPKWRSYIKNETGVDPDAALDEAVRADNACLEGAKKEGVILAIHLCRGNNRSQWYAEGGYDAIAEKLFGQLEVDAFLLEYESERAGTFEPLRFVPRGKTVVLGLISSKLPQMESPDQLKRRINEANKYVPLENLAISPQCGFASTMEGNLLTEEEQWKKLKLVVDTAKGVWGEA